MTTLQVIDPLGGKFCGGLIEDARAAGYNVIVRKFFESCDPGDLVHIDWCDANAVRACGNFPKRRLTVRLHSYELRTEWPGRMLWEQVEKLIFVSPYQRRMFLDTKPDILPKEIVTAPATEHVVALPFVERSGAKDVAIVGRINAEKGFALAVQIARAFPKRGFEWFGESECPYAADYIRANAPNIKLRGELPHDELMHELEDPRFTHLLSCSTREGFPVAVAEGMALGLQPVVHSFNGAAEILSADAIWTDLDDALAAIDMDSDGERGSRFIREKSKTRLSDLVLQASL